MLVVYIKRLKLGVRFYFFSLKIILKENKMEGVLYFIWVFCKSLMNEMFK